MTEDLVPLKEAAEMLGFSRQTLYNYRCRGKGPESHVYLEGNRRRIGYRRADLEAFRAERASPAKAKKPAKRTKAAKPGRLETAAAGADQLAQMRL